MESRVISPALVWHSHNVLTADPTFDPVYYEMTLAHLRETIDDHYMRHIAEESFVPDFIAAYKSETDGWEWEEPEKRPPASAKEAVLRDPNSCPVCKGTKRYPRLMRGQKNGTMMQVFDTKCFCAAWHLLEGEWEKEMKTRKRFAAVRLSLLQPSAASWLPIERQQHVIDQLKKFPEDSYLFIGDANTGKSHFLTALHRNAIAKSVQLQWDKAYNFRSVWRYTTAELLEQHEAWARRGDNASVKPPTLGMCDIREAAGRGLRPCLFLDEIDKIAPTDHKTRTLFGLLEAVYESEGQVVATSNASLDSLLQKWGDDRSTAMLRRIGEGAGAHTIMFEKC